MSKQPHPHPTLTVESFSSATSQKSFYTSNTFVSRSIVQFSLRNTSNSTNGKMYHYRLLYFGIFIHIIFLISIFDIYFKSPIVTGITPEPNTLIPLGKRVVLISVDGLRVDSLFDKDSASGRPVAEYVLNIIKNRGTWGVSQSRVPTESRPGHVAMLAGFYEDPSAVTKGWKENPVDFDSIFNTSRCSFAWGSPDIINIFFKGLKHSCAFKETYEDEQNFAGDSTKYDNWVYNKFQEFLKFSKNSLYLHEEGIFFFLHLLGQDTSGHTDKPHTKKYRQNLHNVDKLVKKIESTIYDFYGDDKTTFIFTSDHGMTNWGSHGAGDKEEINTPFVAWGAGIKKPSDPPKQINIEQADITPLLAILLGSSIPVNSVGVLPISYLSMSKKQIAEAIFLNVKQIIFQYLKLLKNIEENIISWCHVPFKKLLVLDAEQKISFIKNAIKSEKYLEAIFTSKNLIELGLEGLNYYHNYYQKPLLYCISLSYLGWIFYLLLELFSLENTYQNHSNFAMSCVFGFVVIITIILIAIQKLPVLFYIYTLLPEILWYITINKVFKMQYALEKISKTNFFYCLFSVLLAVEFLVLSFFYRWCLCLSVGIILAWSLSFVNFKSRKCLLYLWLLSGCALGFFLFLPVVGGQPDPFMILFSGICLCLLSFASFLFFRQGSTFLFAVRFLALIFSVWNSYVVHLNFNENQELLNNNKHISWFLLTLSFGLLLIENISVLEKLCQIFMCLSVPFQLLTVKHEGFFLFSLFVHLFCWIYVEVCADSQNSTISQIRIAYFFLAYIFLSFFGLGNISSLNSFDPAWLRCFLTIFTPFLMSALILLKTVIPFLCVTSTLRVLTFILKINPERLFVIVLIFCNVMGLNFLFFVKNKGSWLDIGTSISHYVMQQVTIVFLVLLFGVAQLLTKNSSSLIEKESIVEISKSSSQVPSLPTFYHSSKQHKL